LDASKKRPLARLVFGLGIRHVGERSALILSRHYGSIANIAKARKEDLETIHEIGSVMAQSVVNFFQNRANINLIKVLEHAGLNTISHEEFKQNKDFTGKTFVVTGSLNSMTREEIHERITSLGGKVSGSVGAKTDVLIAGENAGSKLRKAKELNIKVLNEDEIKRLFDRAQ
jgi:DNA ligase (NAD+)